MGRGALVLSEPKTSLVPLRLDSKIYGEIRLYATYGLQSFTFAKERSVAQTVQIPQGEYNVSVQSGNQVGQTTIRMQGTKVATLEYSALSWQPLKGADGNSKGGEDSGATVTDSRQHLSYEAQGGVHSGHLVEERNGPFGEISVGAWRWGRGILGVLPTAKLYGRQNQLHTLYGDATNSGVGLLAAVRASARLHGSLSEVYGLGAVGMGWMQQRWHTEYDNNRHSATHPVAQLGMGVTYPVAADFSAGLEARRELVRIEDQELGTQVLGGNIFGATVTFSRR